MVPQWEYVLRLLLAAVLGGLSASSENCMANRPVPDAALIGVGAGMFGVMFLPVFWAITPRR